MIEVFRDKKSETFIISKTDKEGFHWQLQLTEDELMEVSYLWRKIVVDEIKAARGF